MRIGILYLTLFLFIASAKAEVRVFVEEIDGIAWLKYECTAGELVRAFALNAWVNHGRIIAISDYFRGESRPGATGYGIFPASFRDYLTVSSSGQVDWNVPDYTPLAKVADAPSDTLPGLGSTGVTLEFGVLWNPASPDAAPASTGTLCSLHVSEPAMLSVGPNSSRGGVISDDGLYLAPTYVGAMVGPAITSASLVEGVMSITFKGGELQTATELDGQWTDTGNTSGEYSELVGDTKARFYRVSAR